MAANEKNLISLEERIAERVGNELVDLIPEKQWKELINGQIDTFMRNKAPVIIQEMIKDKFMKQIYAILNSPEYEDQWDSDICHATVGLAIEEMLKKSAPDLMLYMVAPAIQSALHDFKNRIGSTLQQY